MCEYMRHLLAENLGAFRRGVGRGATGLGFVRVGEITTAGTGAAGSSFSFTSSKDSASVTSSGASVMSVSSRLSLVSDSDAENPVVGFRRVLAIGRLGTEWFYPP